MTDYTVSHYYALKSQKRSDKDRLPLNEFDILENAYNCITNNIT